MMLIKYANKTDYFRSSISKAADKEQPGFGEKIHNEFSDIFSRDWVL